MIMCDQFNITMFARQHSMDPPVPSGSAPPSPTIGPLVVLIVDITIVSHKAVAEVSKIGNL